jgi:hypothetical protein
MEGCTSGLTARNKLLGHPSVMALRLIDAVRRLLRLEPNQADGTLRWRRNVVIIRPYGRVTPDPPPMHWAPSSHQTMARFKATMTCPDGHGMILRNHRIAANGMVSPSVVCPNPACGFHEFVRLDGWTPGPRVQ